MNFSDSKFAVDGVAVVIPCYNSARTVAQAIESVISEPGVSEIVAIDDGSSDMTLAILRSYEPHIKVLTGPNAGVSAARNRGIAETSARWLLFLDSDDQLIAGTIQKRIEVAKSPCADVVITEWQDAIDDGAGELRQGDHHVVDWVALDEDALVATAVHVWATTAAIIYSRDIVERIGGFRSDLPIIQDARFLYDAALQGARFARSDHIGANYRVFADSLSRRNPSHFWDDVLTNGLLIEQDWRSRGYNDRRHKEALFAIFNSAARGLFEASHPRFFEAVETQRRLGLGVAKHARLATPMARLFGLKAARTILAPLTKT